MTGGVVEVSRSRSNTVAATHAREALEHLARRSPPSYPWLFADVVSVATANTIALGMVVCSYLGARRTADPSTLLVFLNVAAAGIVVALAANTVFMLSALRQLRMLGGAVLSVRATPPRPAPAVGAEIRPLEMLWGFGMTRFHRPGCPAIAGRPVTAATLDAHEGAGRAPCGICTPPGGAA